MSRSSGRNVFDDEAEPQEQLSPAERYARSRQRSAHPRLADFTAAQPFRLDPFQVTACEAVEDGHGVLVCAPTGAGKTLVGEFAVFQALTTGGKCFYTTPIKALSNQKYADLVAIYGTERVGLLTGDTSINPHADAVVMTTEVLRNMLYAGSTDLAGLTAVVLDEIHYLADKFRGAVWEEVILHLADQVQVIGLSATVSNAEEFGAWLQTVRGDTTIVVDEVRPVPLWQHMMVGRRLYDLFTADPEQLEGGRVRIDPTLARAVSAAEGTADRYSSWDRGRGKGWHQPRWRPTPRVDMVERLDGAGLLPAIFFIFSRAGCDAAVGQCVRSGLRLTTDGERAQIREIIDRHTASLPEGDLAVLGYWEWREALERGLAAHHAGLLPAFKETVEELFVEGLVKAVFATETLALGINMPARTVVLEKLVKFNGEGHVDLTPGEYTQLTGRAGRRGIDVEGHAVVVWSPGMDPRTVAGLAAKRTYPLRSSFRPSYNMAVNLVGRMGRSAARDLLEQSFAQYQADSSVVGLVRQQHRNAEAIAGHAKAMTCHLGDVAEYLRLLTDLGDAEKRQAREGAARRRSQTSDDLAALRRGDVIHVPTGRRSGMAVVLDSGVEPDGTARPLVVTDKHWAGRLSTADFRGAVPVLGKVRVDRFTDHRAPGVRRDIASALAAAIKAGTVARPGKNRRIQVDEDRTIADLRRQVRAHPVHGCADRAEHLQWARRWQRLTIENAALAAKVNGAKGSLGEALDRILALLVRHRFVEAGTDELTSAGRMLARLWSESDLVVAECLRSGAWDRLGPPELAAVVSTLVFESRRDNPAGQRVGAKNAAEAIKATQQIWARISADEVDAGLPTTRQPEVGFTGAVAVWARGGSLATALDAAADCGAELSAGDFVRWCRQVIDLLDQIRLIDTSPCAPTAAAAVSALRRGVVALGAE